MDKFATGGHDAPGTELLPPDQLKKNLEAIGIGDDSRVVYYAPDWDPMATRLFFTMDYLGHGNQAALLDGGLDQWTREKRADIQGGQHRQARQPDRSIFILRSSPRWIT